VNKANRAAQFNAFDALKGLQEALREKEEKLSRVERRELAEEQQDALSLVLHRLEKGNLIELTFYYSGHYVTIKDKFVALNSAYRFILVGDYKIYYDDLYEVKMI
jgi:hypothetical protein